MLTRGFKSFLIRLLIFCVLFIAITGILGPWIISTKLLYGFHFFIYANMGKMILFSAVAFIILTRKKIKDIHSFPYRRSNLVFVGLSLVFMPIFYFAGQRLLIEPTAFSNPLLFIFCHALIISIPIFLALGVLSFEFIRFFVRKFRHELLICLGMSVVFYFAIFQVWKLWPYFSGAVLKTVSFLLSFHVSPVREIGPLTLLVGNFAVRIEQACSGLDSIFLFTTLYLLISLVEWQNFHKARVLLLYFPAVIGMFMVNILRVYILILVGVYISPKLALQLFHTYLGMVLFIVYFYFFLSKAMNWLKK
ncbi:hypothetical protein BH09PAT2_BH09PAT2_01530 [soil metagenome]